MTLFSKRKSRDLFFRSQAAVSAIFFQKSALCTEILFWENNSKLNKYSFLGNYIFPDERFFKIYYLITLYRLYRVLMEATLKGWWTWHTKRRARFEKRQKIVLLCFLCYGIIHCENSGLCVVQSLILRNAGQWGTSNQMW